MRLRRRDMGTKALFDTIDVDQSLLPSSAHRQARDLAFRSLLVTPVRFQYPIWTYR